VNSEINDPSRSNSKCTTILVVDDDRKNLALLQDLLESFDFAVLMAEDGESGIQRALYALPDLILLDVLMPGIDGFETCRHLKADKRTREIPVIFMTALADTDSKLKGFLSGGVDYVTKPIEPEEVLVRVKTHIAMHRLQSDLKMQNARLRQEVAKRMQAEEELTRYRERLEELVAERTARIRITMANEQSTETQVRLERNLKFTKALLSAIPTPVFYKDAEGRYLGCNRAFTEIMGVTSEEIHGKTVYEVWSGEQSEMYHRKDLELISNPALQVYEFEVQDKEGRLRNVIFCKDCFTDESNQVAGIVGAFMDITGIKRMEHDLRNARDDLEKRVEERTLELQKTNRQLLHAEKLSAIGSLSASIAHEFNNPLQSVMMVVQGIQADLDKDEKNLMKMALKECQRMRDLIRNLQDFNRPTSGQMSLVDLHASMDSILIFGRYSCKRKNIFVKTEYAPALPLVTAVADQIKQVFLNLLNNAVDACEDSGGTIAIGTSTDGSGNVLITIRDSGKGISSEITPHIFEPFFTTKPAIKGTGLGLSVCDDIIKRHGGHITVDSEPGQGATFNVSLPIQGNREEGKGERKSLCKLMPANEEILS
jgi:PAS domain S-box-containing protein